MNTTLKQYSYTNTKMAFVEPVSLPEEEIRTTNHVLALKLETEDMHRVPPLVLNNSIAKALNLEEIDNNNIISLYKLMGSGNTFYAELPSCVNV